MRNLRFLGYNSSQFIEQLEPLEPHEFVVALGSDLFLHREILEAAETAKFGVS